MTFTTAASVPPAAAEATKEYSPSPRHPAEAPDPQRPCGPLPFTKRGSNAHEARAATVGPVNPTGVPPPSGVNVRVGVAAAVPRFCTTIVETPAPTPATPFTAYGPRTIAAPPARPFAA